MDGIKIKMPKLNIVNETTWSTKDLENIFYRSSEKYGYYPRTIYVVYNNRCRLPVFGKATLGHGWVKIYIPNSKRIYDEKKEKYIYKSLDVLEGYIIKDIAQTYIHELGHNQNLKHKDMICCTNFKVDYVSNLKIRRDEKLIIQKKQASNRKKLKPFIYKEYKTIIYRYPGRVEMWNYTDGKRKYLGIGHQYLFTIYDNKTKKKVYKITHKMTKLSLNELKERIKKIINNLNKKE